MFGNVTSGYTYDLDKFGNYYVPYEAYIATTALNYLMADSEVEEKLSPDDDTYIYKLRATSLAKI